MAFHFDTFSEMRIRRWWLVGVAALAGGGCGEGVGPGGNGRGIAIQVGAQFSCGLGLDARIRCWGRNNFGQLGDGSMTDRGVPWLIGGEAAFSSLGIDGQGTHACAVDDAGQAWCWGDNGSGQLGTGGSDQSASPVQVVGGHRWVSISAGWRFTCGVTESGEGYCWGRGTWGQLGNGGTASSAIPVPVSGDIVFSTIHAGSSSLTCGVGLGGSAYCWGLNWLGELGGTSDELCTSGSTTLPCATRPLRVVTSQGDTFRSITAGLSYACGVLVDGSGYCWGSNADLQLGVESNDVCEAGFFTVACSATPLQIVGFSFASIAAGSDHTCGVDTDGRGVCWGRNTFGQLGNGDLFTERSTPKVVGSGERFASISTGQDHTCGLSVDGGFLCWGMNLWGQVGNPDVRLAEYPVSVADGG